MMGLFDQQEIQIDAHAKEALKLSLVKKVSTNTYYQSK